MTFDQMIDGGMKLMALFAAIGAGWVGAKRVGRSERLQEATAGAEIATAKADEAVNSGLQNEIVRLQEMVKALDSSVQVLARRVADLEIALDGIEAYMDLIILCDECSHKNAKMIARISELLRRRTPTSDGHQARPRREHPPTVQEITKVFAGEETWEKADDHTG